MAATFGTTEDFERLLQRQLFDDVIDNYQTQNAGGWLTSSLIIMMTSSLYFQIHLLNFDLIRHHQVQVIFIVDDVIYIISFRFIDFQTN